MADLNALRSKEVLRADTDDDRTPECFMALKQGESVQHAGNDGSVLCIKGKVLVEFESGQYTTLGDDPIHVRTPFEYRVTAIEDAVIQILGTIAPPVLGITMRTMPAKSARPIWVGNEAYYGLGDAFTVGKTELDLLRSAVTSSPRHRVRLCTHADSRSKLHEMFVCYTSAAKVARHKHLAKDESFHVLEGDLDFVMFNDDGDVTQIIQMGDKNSGKPFYVRVPRDTYHIVSVNSDMCILHEGTAGPFDRAHTVWA